MREETKVLVIGGGSWATALVKILHENLHQVSWYIRNDQLREHVQRKGYNPHYLSSIHFNLDRLVLVPDLRTGLAGAEVVLVVVPSAFLPTWLEGTGDGLKDKFVLTAVKGLVPKVHMTVSEYLRQNFQTSYSRLGVISGPCHAEEVSLERLSYLTFSCKDLKDAERMAALFATPYINTVLATDIYGAEYSAILKNVYAIAVGMAHGLGYGDNFMAILTSNSLTEMRDYLNASYPSTRDVTDSAYLGDLLVTCYSQFSRNRTFGSMIGKGYSVQATQAEMEMVAEGYYAAEGIHALNASHKVHMPIADMVYSVLYEGKAPGEAMQALTASLR